MENNLLFVNQNHDIIRQFMAVMQEYNFKIDTADNGRDAIAFLKRRKYKLMITGMDLSSIDGSKLIAYLNKYFPQTVCIVYTRRLELAHLKLLVNERRVFRIFQNTADFGGEIYSAIMEAFDTYDMQQKEWQKMQILEQKLKNGKKSLQEMRQAALEGKSQREEAAVFFHALFRVYVRNVKIRLPRKERQLLFAYEMELIAHLLDASTEAKDLEALKQKLYQKCSSDERKCLSSIIDGIDQAIDG